MTVVMHSSFNSTALVRAMRSGEINCEWLEQPFRPAAAADADRDDVVQLAIRMLFGRPLVMNAYRSVLVEAIVAIVLGEDWTWCGGDWGECDFVHADGTRLEVKQSAARQSWSGTGTPRPRFDIASRSGRYEGAVWRAEPGRNAELFVFAWHPLIGSEADHRVPSQWQFFVMPTPLLPPTKSIGLAAIASAAPALDLTEVSAAVEKVRIRRAERSGSPETTAA